MSNNKTIKLPTTDNELNMNRILLPFLFLLGISFSACEKNAPDLPDMPPPAELNILLGNPSQATTNVSNSNNYLISLPEYALSYNRTKGIPNWVSWYLSSEWLGPVNRQDDFRPYDQLPAGWYQVSSIDYIGSGFDRGHNCPSGDRTLTVADNSSTFFMVNIIPQAPQVNQDPWEKMETYCRQLAQQGNELYIITGNYGIGGTGNNGFAATISGGKVTVPAAIWKAVLVLPRGENDLSRITENTRLIAVIIPNENIAGNLSWGDYRTTVNQIEITTGYDLFSNIPLAIQDILEAKKDTGPTN